MYWNITRYVPMVIQPVCHLTKHTLLFYNVAAAHTYYRSLSQEQSLKNRGVHEERKKGRRHRERILRVS